LNTTPEPWANQFALVSGSSKPAVVAVITNPDVS
jgi:hypothetical protein